MVSEPLAHFAGWWERCLLWETARPYLYLRTTDDGRAIVGGEDDPFRNPDRRDRLVPEKADRLARRFREMFPAIELEIAYAWAGTFGETEDGLAYIGAVPEAPSCFFALGFGGNGVTCSAVAAEIIRDAIQRRPNTEAHLFRFDRQAPRISKSSAPSRRCRSGAEADGARLSASRSPGRQAR
jgi:glycine/D-amino acid oxidase-like deaminating enzyme